MRITIPEKQPPPVICHVVWSKTRTRSAAAVQRRVEVSQLLLKQRSDSSPAGCRQIVEWAPATQVVEAEEEEEEEEMREKGFVQ